MKRFKWDLLVAGVAVCVLAGYMFYAGEWSLRPQPSGERPVHALYVWQRAWNDDVRDSLTRAAEQVRHLMVLAHEDDMPPIAVDWKALADTRLAVTLVFRYPAALGKTLESDGDEALARVVALIETKVQAAVAQGVRLKGVQLDYDAPTRTLGAYNALVRGIRTKISPDLALSITALPTWLDQRDFSKLVKPLDYYVLQVHSIERPGDISSPLLLCDTTRIDGYVQRAERVGVPYFIAFPTHGYEAAFDASGKFLGLSAEGPAPGWPRGTQLRAVRAEPSAIAGAVNKLAREIPPLFRGAVWFRMPVASDTRNWTWPVLAAVMEGRIPSVRFKAEVRHPDHGLAEIWLTSYGEDRPECFVDVGIRVPRDEVLASDLVNGFQTLPGEANGPVILRGAAPVGTAPILIGWYRMKGTEGAEGVAAVGVNRSGQSTDGSAVQ